MTDLGWLAKSAQLPRKREEIEGLRDDFAIRVRSAVESMRDQSTKDGDVPAKKSKGRLHLQQNKGVQARAKADFEMQETDEDKERKRQEALERKAALYQELQNRVNLDDEAANDTYDVDFIGKALQGDATILDQDATAEPIRAEPLHPEEILRRQQELRKQIQGGESRREEYSTYDQDRADLDARHQRVDELDQMNSERKAEFELLKRKRQGLSKQKDQEAVKAKQDILKRLLAKKQRQK